ncbi:MAG: response regulator [Oligoflexus sp.]
MFQPTIDPIDGGQAFSQGDSSNSRHFGGTGLGLAISQRLAEALGGKVCVEECEEGKGASFLISLLQENASFPRTEATSAKAGPRFELESSTARKTRLEGTKILVADDSYDNQKFMMFVLKKHGAEVVLAANGLEVIDSVKQQDVDVILMDIQMPQVDGFEATRMLRQGGFTKPIIALTAHAMLEERVKTQQAGCNAHLTKPIDISELINTIENHLLTARK